MKSALHFVTPGPDGELKFILDQAWTGTEQRSVPVELHDMRARAGALSLEREGFVLSRVESAVTDYLDQEQLDRLWEPAVEHMILRVTGGKWAALFAGPNVRFSEAHQGSTGNSVSAPARAVHSDLPGNFTFDLMDRQPVTGKAMSILRRRLGETEPKRWQIFNIWQMISHPPQDCTLALCDRTSFDVADIVEGKGFFDDPDLPREKLLAQRTDEADFSITFLRENPAQRWCYISDMCPGEALIFNTFDPHAGPGRARVPHGAVDLTDAAHTAVPRNSIEIRALVVFEE